MLCAIQSRSSLNTTSRPLGTDEPNPYTTHTCTRQNYPDSVDKLHAALKMVHGHALDNFRRYHHQQQHQASPQFQSHEQLEDAAHAFARAVVERELVRRDGSGSTPLIGAAKYGCVPQRDA